MFTRIFGKPKQETNAVATLDKLNEGLDGTSEVGGFWMENSWKRRIKREEFSPIDVTNGIPMLMAGVVTLEMLEKKEKVLQKKAAAEVERAKEFTRAKNKRAAIQCLKRKKMYEQQIETLGNFQLRIHDQMIMLEGAKATTETVDALRTGAAAMKAMQKATNIDDVDKTMDEINEQTENMKQIQEALAAPIGAAADFDEDELEAELEELEGAELEEQLLQPATTAPAAPVYVPAGRQPVRPAPQKATAEDEELAALQAEMAL
ncbi:Vacuolar sorting-associated protein [Nymphaea thermarum]|nr:Vacuolar sorting-associated protein [Nymphaea thermarum]